MVLFEQNNAPDERVPCSLPSAVVGVSPPFPTPSLAVAVVPATAAVPGLGKVQGRSSCAVQWGMREVPRGYDILPLVMPWRARVGAMAYGAGQPTLVVARRRAAGARLVVGGGRRRARWAATGGPWWWVYVDSVAGCWLYHDVVYWWFRTNSFYCRWACTWGCRRCPARPRSAVQVRGAVYCSRVRYSAVGRGSGGLTAASLLWSLIAAGSRRAASLSTSTV